jgi:FkbM family methyltransferase
VIRRTLKTLSGAARSFAGTNGLFKQITVMDEKLSALSVVVQDFLRQLEKAIMGSPPPFRFGPLVLPDGSNYELSVDAGDPDAYHQAVASGGTNDANWLFINKRIRPGNVFFDVGANIWTISIPAALCGAIVHSFELLASNVQHLLRSTERNGINSLSVVLGGVSDYNEPVGIGGTSAWGTVVPTAGARLSIAATILDVYATCVKLPELDLMKIDVEGSELSALRGSVDIIAKCVPEIVIEGNVVTSGNAGYSYNEILANLVNHDYQIFRLHSNRLCPWDNKDTQVVIFADYFATKKSPAEVAERSGWAISKMTAEELIDSVELQDQMPFLHKQYILSVKEPIPPELIADPRMSLLLRKWRHLDDDAIRKIMLTGAQ